MPPMARRILHAKPKHVSLVRRGANKIPSLYKSDDDGVLDTIFKAGDDFEERGELLAVVYAPEYRDSHGDIASADVIKEMCHEFARDGAGIDIRHNERVVPKSAAYVAENFVIQKGDPRFADLKDADGQQVDPTGGWGMLIKIDDPALRQLYREGIWNGVSLHAPEALLRLEKSSNEDRLFTRLLKLLGLADEPDQSGDDDMNSNELTSALSKALEPIGKGIEALLKKSEPETKTEEAPKPPTRAAFRAPVFKGDRTPLNIKEHALKVKLAKAEYDTEDFTNPEKTEEYAALADEIQKELDEIQTQKDEIKKAAGAGKSENDQKIAALEAQIAHLRKSSNQRATDGAGGGTQTGEITKEHTEPASRMAKYLNGTAK